MMTQLDGHTVNFKIYTNVKYLEKDNYRFYPLRTGGELCGYRILINPNFSCRYLLPDEVDRITKEN